MWTRESIKERAKAVLRNYYWVAFLVTLAATVLIGWHLGFRMDHRDFNAWNWHWSGGYNDGYPNVFSGIAGILFGSAVAAIALIASAFAVAYALFVGGPIQTGSSRYFIDARRGKSDFVNLFYAFQGGRYMSIVKAMGWKYLFTFLWTLLLIIPGIVKAYAYSMVPYIMAENPAMGYQTALKLSMKMTYGQKFDIFVLDLSFLGWYLLGLLACGLGAFFVNPYYFATKAELYAELKMKALTSGYISENGTEGYTTSI